MYWHLSRLIVKVAIKTRIVTVEGPRGKLVKDLGHVAVNFGHPSKNVISIEIHHGNRKNVATLRTVKSIISNMVIGVTKGFKYKMRYVYAHFPINVNVDENKETGLWEVEIRNFIGEKIVRRVVMAEGVNVAISASQKDELVLSGNSLENVSQSAADIQQICKVRNKDIRKVRYYLYWVISCGFFFFFSNRRIPLTARLPIGIFANLVPSSWTVCTFPRRATLLRSKFTDTDCFFCVSGSYRRGEGLLACHVANGLHR